MARVLCGDHQCAVHENDFFGFIPSVDIRYLLGSTLLCSLSLLLSYFLPFYQIIINPEGRIFPEIQLFSGKNAKRIDDVERNFNFDRIY
jgi:hypothetical protein